ncbi:Mitogen-activated protein kinase kinase kinase 11 [Monoraphidium neglectum]|uniref:Mitogen-activated protein kinase kinase kinase 11 n=1 Tax=Monoraphidium neglectum TaxID=145388 RepID=A0A0D2MUQ1_9CHLO|nr:Mitogen-activated protein kinase kinase kinase 11 [Monoraphidium neglectum]KIZ04237.1 Mitogen-activated protein kinase kinase kinase 11 [Monoraphidium neglectum]|eukprot:XP_013903256.1 Mitogen-activated protein kinase kinase kinase 11 [Monoraphidium neglectum]
MRFFACAPFFGADGRWMGAICCCDPEPRAEVGMAHQQTLEYFAEQALREVEEMIPDLPLVPPKDPTAGQWRTLARGSRRISIGDDWAPGAHHLERQPHGSLLMPSKSEGGYDSGRHTLLGASSSCQESTSRSSLLSSFSSSNCGAGGGSSFSTAVTAVGSSCGAAVASGRAARLSLSGDDALSQLRLGAVLGAGNFGRVYMGTYHGAPVAVKALDTVTQRDPQSGAALEAELSAALSHPNIVRTLAWHEANGQTWLVLDYADKGTLQAAVDSGAMRGPGGSGGSVNLLRALATTREVASGMAYLHALGILHCDLTASNVLLSSRAASDTDARGFVAQISDFGLSLVLEEGHESVTASDHGAATAMAPEVLSQRLVSKAADVYSFGVLLWQICTGEQPWRGMTRATLLHAVCVERRRLEFGPASDVPECLQLLAAACMAHDPSDRPTFRDILEILQPLGQLFPGSA